MPMHADIPTDVLMTPGSLSPAQRRWLEDVVVRLDENRMGTLGGALTSIPRPTAAECAVNESMVQHLGDIGLTTFYQPVDVHSGNAIVPLPRQGHAGA